MGSVKQAVEAICLYGGEPRPRTGQVARHLQTDGMVPTSAGRRIEHLGPTHLATLILAVATAPQPADATRSALTWGRMTPNGVAIDWNQPAEQRPVVLIQALTGCIDMVWKEAGRGPMTNIVVQSSFEFATNRPHALVTLNGETNDYLPVGGDKEFPGFQRVIRVSGATLRRIAMAVYEPHYNAILALQSGSQRDPYRDPADLLSASPVR
jgi:hypothetical protein